MTKEGQSNHHQTITNETLMISAAAISAFCSFFVVLSSILFPAMRKKKFTQLIFLMSACDMFGNMFAAFGFPKNTSPLCPIQGALRTFFYRASWFWSVVLTYQLFCTVCFGIIGVSKKVAHISVWVSSVLLLLLPLSTNQYGQDDQISGIGWCSIAGNTLDAGIWLLVTSQIPVSIAILCNVWYVYQMDRFVSNNFSDINKSYPQISTALTTLRLYPIVMIIAWLPSTVMGPLINFRGVPINENTIFYMGLTEAWGGLFGFGLFAIFFTKNKEAIFYWGLLWAYVKVSISGGDTASEFEGLFGRSNNLGDAQTASNTHQNAGNNKTSSLNRPLFNKFSQIPTKGIFIDNDDDAFNYYTGSSNKTNNTGNTISSKMFSSQEGSSYRSQMDSTHSRNSVSHFKGFAREQSLESNITNDSSMYSSSKDDSRNNQDIISSL